jgi:hypothetical protein
VMSSLPAGMIEEPGSFSCNTLASAVKMGNPAAGAAGSQYECVM